MIVSVSSDKTKLPITDVEGPPDLRIKVDLNHRKDTPVEKLDRYEIGYADGDLWLYLYFVDGTAETIRINAETLRFPRLGHEIAYTVGDPVGEAPAAGSGDLHSEGSG